MPISIVVGGQFGSEGKGKIAYELAKTREVSHAIRVGGPNSGHTVIDDRHGRIVFRQLPTAALLPNVVSVLPPGAYVDVEILLREVAIAGLGADRLVIDPNAFIVTEADRKAERESGIRGTIGSTATGTGAALQRRISRKDGSLARNDPRLSQFIQPTLDLLRGQLDSGKRIVIEGTQGYGLSLLHSHHYPFVTSRDTTAAGFLAESGLSPMDVDEIILVIRAFPIRVPGNSGPLPNETDWTTIEAESKSMTSLVEYTSVTAAVRRVARFDASIVKQAILANRPTSIVLNHVDHVDSTMHESGKLSTKGLRFVADIEAAIGHPISQVGLRPNLLVPRNLHRKSAVR